MPLTATDEGAGREFGSEVEQKPRGTDAGRPCARRARCAWWPTGAVFDIADGVKAAAGWVPVRIS
ncbi:hypothetical protein OHT57_04220 [Streptomyces sp. NBC_00285]|uniref:hypothetical protein n=1 Tax=Streptomyces sp. NBC_00285 TaxID=2975700 RepID=UPI002E2DD642|nr:hypothetical protein [Streptomyces sp. NBC_00285]